MATTLKTFLVEWLDDDGALISSCTLRRERITDCLGARFEVSRFAPSAMTRITEMRITEVTGDEA